MKSFIAISTVFVIFLGVTSAENPLKDTTLINYRQYMQDVFKIFVEDLEDLGFSNLRMKDFDQFINETLYGFEVLGNVSYSDGFMVSVQNITMMNNHTNEILLNTNLTAGVKSIMRMDVVTVVYDVMANLDNQEQKATGFYTFKGIEWTVEIEKDLQTDVITAKSRRTTVLSDSEKRIMFLPKTDYTTVFARHFKSYNTGVTDGLSSWSIIFDTLFDDIVNNKIKFPDISYDRFTEIDE